MWLLTLSLVHCVLASEMLGLFDSNPVATNILRMAQNETAPEESVARTVDTMMEKAGLADAGEVKDVVSYLLTKDLKATTLRRVLVALNTEIDDPEERKKFMKVARKVDGLHHKKARLIKRITDMVDLDTNSTEQLVGVLREQQMSSVIKTALTGADSKTSLKLRRLNQEMKGWGKKKLGVMNPHDRSGGNKDRGNSTSLHGTRGEDHEGMMTANTETSTDVVNVADTAA